MESSGSPKIRGWIFDVYPMNVGEMAVWIKSEHFPRIRLTDKFQPKIYVSGQKENVERLVGCINYSNPDVAHWDFVYKYTNPTDCKNSLFLEITLKDCRRVSALTRQIMRICDSSRYEVHAGNSVKFVFTHSEDWRHERRVKATQLIDKATNPDIKKCIFLLCSSVANLLSLLVTQFKLSMKQFQDKAKAISRYFQELGDPCG